MFVTDLLNLGNSAVYFEQILLLLCALLAFLRLVRPKRRRPWRKRR